MFELFLIENSDKYLKVRSRAMITPQKKNEDIILIYAIITLTQKSESNVILKKNNGILYSLQSEK